MFLITSDLHLTDRKEDDYRFELFKWMIENYSKTVRIVMILGDLTDRKNYHADRFVNKIADHIEELASHFGVLILRGNHDTDADPDIPFFGFLGKIPNVTYFSEPTFWSGKHYGWGRQILFLPHSREPGKDWNLNDHQDLDAICLHQTFKGAVSESGFALGGLGTFPFRQFECPIFSGDVHAPQQTGPITYVGSPYHVHYGDQFEPRVLLIDRDFNTVDVHFPAPKKFVFDLKHAKELRKYRRRITKGDQAKIRLHLPTSKRAGWPSQQEEIRKIADQLGLILENIVLKELIEREDEQEEMQTVRKRQTPTDVYRDFCQRNQVGENLMQAGKAFMEE